MRVETLELVVCASKVRAEDMARRHVASSCKVQQFYTTPCQSAETACFDAFVQSLPKLAQDPGHISKVA